MPDTSVTGYGRTTWLEFKAPPKGRKILEYISHSMNQLHTMCRLDKPAGLAHYVIWDQERHMSLWRPVALMFLIRQNKFYDPLPLTRAQHVSCRKVIINRLYDPMTLGGLSFGKRGYEILQTLLTGEDS